MALAFVEESAWFNRIMDVDFFIPYSLAVVWSRDLKILKPCSVLGARRIKVLTFLRGRDHVLLSF